jgi:hypothetical protein
LTQEATQIWRRSVVPVACGLSSVGCWQDSGVPVQRIVMIGATAVVVLLTGSCGSSDRNTLPSPTTTTTRSPGGGRDALAFRQVLGVLPYDGASTSSPSTQESSGSSAAPPLATSCNGGKLVTSPQDVKATAQVILADRRTTACYLLGPTLLTGRDLDSAAAVREASTGAWVVNVHFKNDDFVNKVATPHPHEQIAIIFRGVVESAPTINEGITGRDVTIGGAFDEETARDLAVELS